MEHKGGYCLVHEECIVHTYCGMPKGTSWAETMLNSEKIKLIALAVIEVCLSEGASFSQASVEIF